MACRCHCIRAVRSQLLRTFVVQPTAVLLPEHPVSPEGNPPSPLAVPSLPLCSPGPPLPVCVCGGDSSQVPARAPTQGGPLRVQGVGVTVARILPPWRGAQHCWVLSFSRLHAKGVKSPHPQVHVMKEAWGWRKSPPTKAPVLPWTRPGLEPRHPMEGSTAQNSDAVFLSLSH